MQLEKIHEYLQIGEDEGAELWCTNCDVPDSGYFCRPTLFLGLLAVAPHRAGRNLRPGLAVQTFRTVEEAIEKANNTPYGLERRRVDRQGIEDFQSHEQAPRRRDLGEHVQQVRPDVSPFGGYKESGIGREGGLHGLLRVSESELRRSDV